MAVPNHLLTCLWTLTPSCPAGLQARSPHLCRHSSVISKCRWVGCEGWKFQDGTAGSTGPDAAQINGGFLCPLVTTVVPELGDCRRASPRGWQQTLAVSL